MAMILRLLARVVVIASVALSVGSVSAQNVMHLRIDTVTAQPGATVDVRVLYTFISTHAHDIHDFTARFLFDTSESQLVAYILAGTASAALKDTTGSHNGLLALGNQEIDLTDSVLFKIRMTIDSNADTAWIRWDSNWYHGYGLAVFTAGDEGIDSVSLEDGWIRTPQMNAVVQSQLDTADALQFYPNPATEQVTIKSPGYASDAELEVFDALGRQCFLGPLVSGAWKIPYGFPTGAYHLVLSDDGRIESKSIGTLIVAPR